MKVLLGKDLGEKGKATTKSILLGKGKDQENLTEVLWQQLWPYILLSVYIHVCTGSCTV